MGIHSTGIFSERVTLESKPDGRKFRSFKSGSTRASDVVADIYATASFGLKMSMEKVGGNRKGPAISSHIHLSFSEEKKMRFSGGEVVFHRLKIRTKTTNVAEVNGETVGGGIKTP